MRVKTPHRRSSCSSPTPVVVIYTERTLVTVKNQDFAMFLRYVVCMSADEFSKLSAAACLAMVESFGFWKTDGIIQSRLEVHDMGNRYDALTTEDLSGEEPAPQSCEITAPDALQTDDTTEGIASSPDGPSRRTKRRCKLDLDPTSDPAASNTTVAHKKGKQKTEDAGMKIAEAMALAKELAASKRKEADTMKAEAKAAKQEAKTKAAEERAAKQEARAKAAEAKKTKAADAKVKAGTKESKDKGVVRDTEPLMLKRKRDDDNDHEDCNEIDGNGGDGRGGNASDGGKGDCVKKSRTQKWETELADGFLPVLHPTVTITAGVTFGNRSKGAFPPPRNDALETGDGDAALTLGTPNVEPPMPTLQPPLLLTMLEIMMGDLPEEMRSGLMDCLSTDCRLENKARAIATTYLLTTLGGDAGADVPDMSDLYKIGHADGR